ncbi:titin homolog [Spodoptera frugiperda]|uniref:Mediator of DNA damage checkpoint protein 1 n=1 Tax=Spodoptera frugiperda TaxID=7108 RepID=A0A9R0DN02_SPOFR|nr:titin homolog [Spodoptera frugiperda]
MECTQRLECTQELNHTQRERTCPEQIGYLGICGAKHPVLKGPNKIGRDPQTCNIILNLNSISRQHAVINVLNSKEFMLMDLDSANKTKLLNKTLQPYIPNRIKDGDTVQFGDIFGVFRLLEEDNELPMTQAIDIPETPVTFKHVTKLNNAPTTLIPESPDVSDRDDSFVTPSQPISMKSRLSNSFMKTNRTLTLAGTSRTSPNKSTSIGSVHNPNTSLNESFISLKTGNVSDNIYGADTQVPNLVTNESTDSIFTAGTQIPPGIAMSPSVHTMDTQEPTMNYLHTMDTQMPTTENLPQVRKIDDQHEMQINIFAANKENNKDIFNGETQPFGIVDDPIENENKNKSNVPSTSKCSTEGDKKDTLNTSEEVLFDDIDGECFEEDFHSQNILQGDIPLIGDEDTSRAKDSPILCNGEKKRPSDDLTDCEDIDMLPTQKVPELPKQGNNKEPKVQDINVPTCSKRAVRIKSDSSTDCEDVEIAPTQIVPELPAVKDAKSKSDITEKPSKRVNRIKSDSSTDCEDIDIAPTQIIPELPAVKDSKMKADKITNVPSKRVNRIKSDSSTDCEDIDLMATQKIPEIKPAEDDDATDCEDDVIVVNPKEPPPIPLIDDDTQIATQIIPVDNNKKEKIPFEDMATQVISVDEGASGSKNVSFEDQPTQVIDEAVPSNKESLKKPVNVIESPFKIPFQSPIRIKSKDIPKVDIKDKIEKNNPIEVDPNYYNDTQDIFDDLCTQRDVPDVQPVADDDVVPCSVEDYKVKDKFAGIERDLSPFKNKSDETTEIATLEKVPSGDLSDVDSTPKKAKPFVFTDSDLPSSQEIKKCLVSHTRSFGTEESSSDSETENNIDEPFNPFQNLKKKSKAAVVVDLTKRLDVDKLPERVITRQRKPALNTESISAKILKPTYLTEQEDHIDQEIITENIKRLKTYEQTKNNKHSKKDESVKEGKKENVSQKTTDKVSEPKDKLKVKIEKPKKKETKQKSKEQSETSRANHESHNNQVQEKSLDTATATRPTTRSTRSKKKDTERETTETKSSTDKTTVKDNKRKRTNKKQEKERSASPEMITTSTKRSRTPKSRSKSPEVEVRRSTRQRKPKTKFEESEVKAPKSILKNTSHEQSTVYNISSSSTESPRSLKRSMLDCSDAPSSKRTRAQANSSSTSSISNASLRATPARIMKTHHVLFTAFPSADVKQKLEKLGAAIVTDVMACTVVLTMQIKRTFKLLCAVGLGRPIVGPGWVQACSDTRMIVDPWLYLVKDDAAEKRFQFSLQKTLSSSRNFLKGYNVSSTPNVQPNASEMKLIVECSGGTWKEGGPNWVCVSCTKDKELWPALRRRGAVVVSTEFILGGVLRQKLDIASNTFN